MPTNYSLSEVDSLCRKAARGVGYSWGLAEEAGKLARGLTALGLPGAELLLDILVRADQGAGLAFPSAQGDVWSAADNPKLVTCPIVAGAIVSDRSQRLAAGEAFQFEMLLQPLALVPSLLRVADAAGICISLTWGDQCVKISSTGLSGVPPYRPDEVATVRCSITNASTATLNPQPQSRFVSSQVWDRLNELAQRTYVPASEASRLSGAGAGLNDND